MENYNKKRELITGNEICSIQSRLYLEKMTFSRNLILRRKGKLHLESIQYKFMSALFVSYNQSNLISLLSQQFKGYNSR